MMGHPLSLARVLLVAVVVAAGTLALAAQAPSPRPPAGLDTAALDRIIGRPGQALPGDVYRFAFPRTDLEVTVGDVTVRPGLALGSWAAFKAAGAGAVVHGDLVLLDSEVNPVISALEEHDFEITAVHNHLLNEMPAIAYVHYWGRGDASMLAEGVKDALGRSRTPIAAPTAPAAPAASSAPEELPVERIQQAIGLRGTLTNGVLAFAQPRPETIEMMGVTMPPSMGMATSINFQAAGPGRVAATGDFVMLADEVNKVLRDLRQADIAVTALHNHLLASTPELYFMHFWAEGDPVAVATGLKTALGEIRR
jgi:hypothetical protein